MSYRISRRLLVAAFGVFCTAALASQPASAQFGNSGGISSPGQLGGGSSSNFGSGSTSSGMFGNRTVGSGSGLSAGNRTFAGSGGAAGGMNGQQQLGSLQNGTSGGVQSNARFLRQNRNGAFVGSDQGDVATSLQMLGGGQNAANARNALQNLRGTNNQRRSQQPNQGNSAGGRNALPPYRVAREAELTVRPSATALVISDRLTQRVNHSTSIQTEGPVEVEVRGRIAILRGLVSTGRARDLAVQLVLLEPGVDQVDNQLQVPGEESAEE